MKLRLNPLRDDHTKQFSLSRIMCLVIIIYCMISMYGKDIPIGWAGLVTALYFGNKASSTTKEIMDSKSSEPAPAEV